MYKLNCNFYYHYFGHDMVVINSDRRYLLNEYQAFIVSQINETGSIDSIVDYFAQVTDEDRHKVEELLDSALVLLLKTGFVVPSNKREKVPIYGESGKYYPKKITIELTNKCHLQCVHCFKEASPVNRDHLTSSDLIRFLDEIKDKVYSIQLTGGEPMAHPHFKKIIEYVLDNFSDVSMTTTGHLINSKNIEYIKRLSYVQVSLYHYNPEQNDSITNGKDILLKTLRGIKFLNESGVDYSVTNIVRKNLIDEFDDFIDYLIYNQVKSIRFGLFSHLGRGKSVGSEWFLNAKEIEKFYDMLIEKSKDYKNQINIHTWESDTCSSFFEDTTGEVMKCGAGIIEWTINEYGELKPCPFFPDNDFLGYSIENYQEYASLNNESSIISKINDWESLLRTVGLSTKNVCEEIYRVVENK